MVFLMALSFAKQKGAQRRGKSYLHWITFINEVTFSNLTKNTIQL